MAALNKCNPAQLLILHIIKFLIYTLCFRGPTHNSLVLNSRGIKTNARRAPGRRHLPGLTVPASKAERKAREKHHGARGAETGERVSPGSQALCSMPRAQHRRGGSAGPAPSFLSWVSRARARARAHTHAPHTHTRGGRAGLRDTQASLADIFLWEDFKRAVKARNYTGYKLRNPWPARDPLPTSDPAPSARHGARNPPKDEAHPPTAWGNQGDSGTAQGPISLLTRGPLPS